MTSRLAFSSVNIILISFLIPLGRFTVLSQQTPSVTANQKYGHNKINGYMKNSNNHSNMNSMNSNVGINRSDCPQVKTSDLVNCRCQYPGEDLYNDNRRLVSTQGVAVSTSQGGHITGKRQLGGRRTNTNIKSRGTGIANRKIKASNTLKCISTVPDCSTCKNGTDGIAVLPSTHAACQRVQFVCPGEVIVGTVWTHQCSRGARIESDNTRQLIVNAPSQGGRGSSTKRTKRIAESRQSRSLLTTQWNNKSSNGNGKIGVRGYGHKRRPRSFEPTPSGNIAQDHTAQDIIIKNCNDGTCPGIILPANHPQCSGSNIPDIATVYTSTPVPAENQQAPPSFATGSPSLGLVPNAPIPPTVKVDSPVPAPSQPIVRMPISNSVPVSVDPFTISTTTPSQGGNNLGPPQQAETSAPSFGPAEIQGAPPVYITDSPSLDPFP